MKRCALFFPYVVLGAVLCVLVLANLPAGGGAGQDRRDGMPELCPSCGMVAAVDGVFSAPKERHEYRFCSANCRDRFLHDEKTTSHRAPGKAQRRVDVVCGMEVNAAWGISTEHGGRTYDFCNQQCKKRFEADPEYFLELRCLVCDRPFGGEKSFPASYLGTTYYLCSDAHRAAFKRDPAGFFMHSMWGIPSWLYYGSIAIVLVVSFGVFERRSPTTTATVPWTHRSTTDGGAGDPVRPTARQFTRASVAGEGERLVANRNMMLASGELALPVFSTRTALSPCSCEAAATSGDRIDLLSFRWFGAAVRSRVFRFAVRAVVAAVFVVIITAGLFGNQNPALNIAPILTWTVWWGLLIVLILFAGKAWCYVCPWDAMAEWSEKLALWRKNDDGLSVGLKWPRFVRNILIATILFVGLTWIELGFGVTMRPRVTAYLAVAMLLMAIVSALLFDRKSFCRYGCLVGRVSGLYALFASVEVRPKSAGACQNCRTKECVTGSDRAYGCPTFLYPGKLDVNTYCIQCMECVQACPRDNVAVNLRPWGTDLVSEGKPRTDEAYLALLMLAITGFHGLTMTPVWQQLVDAIRAMSGAGRIIGFSLGMALLMIGPILVYAALVAISMLLGRGKSLKPLRYRDYFIRYAYALLPIALFYHIAHNMEHLLMEGPKVVTLASDPLGWGWNLFGTASWVIPPMISLEKLWIIQVALVLIGHVYSLWIAQKTSRRLFGNASAALRSQLPMLAAMIAFSVFSLWLLKQPMEMRTSAM